MNRLNTEKRVQVISALVEGSSINAILRMTGVAKHTVLKLLEDMGCACAAYHHRSVRDLRARRIQCDEILGNLSGPKQRMPLARKEQRDGATLGLGLRWMPIQGSAFRILSAGGDTGWATDFAIDIRERVVGRPQITTDAYKPYLRPSLRMAFGDNVDYAQMHKIYGVSGDREGRYVPATCIGCEMKTVIGSPDYEHVSTSFVERQNLTMRMSMRRFTRLTNGFSKKIENHGHAVALHFMHYNFVRIHKTLRVTPAMEAGIADHVWSMEELVALLESKQIENLEDAA